MTPTLLFDGECSFCRAQAARLRRVTRARVAMESAYDPGVRARFPMLPQEGMLGEMKLVDADGRVYGGAAAAARAIQISGGVLGLLAGVYWLPVIRPIADRLYHRISMRRSRFGKMCTIDQSVKGPIDQSQEHR